MSIAACVLAAGAGRRIGGSKALLEARGQTLVDQLLAALRGGGAAPLFVVGRAWGEPQMAAMNAVCFHHGATLLINPEPERGMLSSLHACLRAILANDTRGFAERGGAPGASSVEALFVAPVDCPSVRAATIAQLAAAFRATGAPVVVPAFAGRRGHPTLFAARLFQELLDAPPEVGARAVVWRHANDRVEVAVPDAAVLDDIDTPEALDELNRRI